MLLRANMQGMLPMCQALFLALYTNQPAQESSILSVKMLSILTLCTLDSEAFPFNSLDNFKKYVSLPAWYRGENCGLEQLGHFTRSHAPPWQSEASKPKMLNSPRGLNMGSVSTVWVTGLWNQLGAFEGCLI